MQRTARLRVVVLSLAAVVLAATAVLVLAVPAWAHTALVSSTPAADAQVARAPSEVTLTFNENIATEFATVRVVGPDGQQVNDGPPRVDGPTVTATLTAMGPAGSYTVGYRVVSADGHPVTGQFAFTISAAGTVAPTTPSPTSAVDPASSSTTDSGMSPILGWVLLAAVVLVVLLVSGGIFLRRRNSSD